MKRILIFLGLAFSVLGCGPNVLFENPVTIPETGWTYADSVDLSFEIKDTARVYDIFLEVDHLDAYGFQNLYVKTRTVFPSGKTDLQVLSLELADKIGFWLGKCSGGNCHLSIPIQQQIFFPETGKYTFHLEQNMRQSPIAGISKINFKIVDTGKKR